MIYGQNLLTPIAEKDQRAYGPKRCGHRDAGYAEPWHQQEVESDVQYEVQESAIEDQFGAAHCNQEPVVDAAADEEWNLQRIDDQHR